MQLVNLSRRLRVRRHHGLLAAYVLVSGGCGGPTLASVSTAPVTESVVFENIAVFDGERVLADQDVLVSGPTIVGVGPAGSGTTPAGALRIPGEGRMLLPGLVDSHVHLFSAGEKEGPPPDAAQIAEAFLYAGVTTVLVTAGYGEAEELEAEGALGPHFFTAGPGLTAPGGHPIPLLRAMLPWPLSWAATRRVPTAGDPDGARREAARTADVERPPFYKIIYDDLPPGGAPHLSLEILRAAVDAARERGMRPIVHATTPSDTIEAAEAGAALLVHVPQRGRLEEAQVARLQELGTPFVSTVRLVSASLDLADEGPIPLEREMYPSALLQPWRERPSWDLVGFSEEIDQHRAETAEITQGNFQALYAAGVPVLAGTDSGVHGVFPGASLHRELRLLVRLGMSPLDALRAATSAPATFLDPQGSFGRIAPGQRADLLVVEGDPTIDIEALSDIREVFLGGRRLKRAALETGS